MEKKFMSVKISEYKESILDMFQSLTETEIEITKNVMKSDPKNNGDYGTVYLMAINRCRQLLETILKDK
jgi:hypothetical protein